MYCRNCGNQLSEVGDVCLKCGVKVGEGNKYCPHCGAAVDEKAAICVHCGAQFTVLKDQKSKIVAGILGILLGGWGVHNFYLGYFKRGFVKLGVNVIFIFVLIIAPIAMSMHLVTALPELYSPNYAEISSAYALGDVMDPDSKEEYWNEIDPADTYEMPDLPAEYGIEGLDPDEEILDVAMVTGIVCVVAGLAIFSMWIWGFVEGVMILCGKINKDAKGNLLKS